MSLNNILLGGIWYSSAVNNARTARIQQELAQQNRLIAENHRLAQETKAEQQRINQLRETVFNFKKGIEYLEQMAHDDPLGTYLNILEYELSIQEWNINPNMFPEFSDKEYTSNMLEAKSKLMLQLEQTLGPDVVQKAIRYNAIRSHGLPQLQRINDWIEILGKYPGGRPMLVWLLHPILTGLYGFSYGQFFAGWRFEKDPEMLLIMVVPALLGLIVQTVWKSSRKNKMKALNAIANRRGGWVALNAKRTALEKIRDGMIANYKNLQWECSHDSESNNDTISSLEQEMSSIASEFQLQLTQ